jgi:hypothetical protein
VHHSHAGYDGADSSRLVTVIASKQVGDKVGVTVDGGDAPIVLFSLLGLLGTLAFGVYAAGNL